MIGWLSPSFITDVVSTELLTVALYFNVICVDAQILCFPILDFMEAQKSLTTANQDLEVISNIDELTGLLNRRTLNVRLDIEISRYKTDNVPFSVILFDLDHFKNINDNFGHLTGDIVLKQIARLTKQLVRPSDLVMRYGGEEFIVLLLETDCSEALSIAERLCAGIAQCYFDHPDIPSLFHITASFGVAGLRTDQLSMGELLKRADIALYKAKTEGRNRVCI
jgi:diguanylate cyclase (GGDEF)-like protein